MTKVISVDTDGIYISNHIDINKLNNYLDNHIKEIFNLKNQLHVEIDEYDAAYFRATKGKHYILKEGEKLLFHGQSFKGSHLPSFFDTVLEQCCRDMFMGKDVRKNVDVTKFNIDEIKQSKKVKDKGEYKDDSSLSMNLIKQAEQVIGATLNDNEQISYVKTNKGYEIFVPGREYDIDWKYYQAIVEKIYERLEIEDTAQWKF